MTTTTRRPARPASSATSARPAATPPRAGTATTSAPGTWSRSTATAIRSAAAAWALQRRRGSRRTSPRTAKPCTLAYWHTPLYSSGSHGNNAGGQASVAGALRQRRRARPERSRPRLRAFRAAERRRRPRHREGHQGVHRRHRRPLPACPRRDAPAEQRGRDDTTFGVLDLKLNAAGYDWQFVPVPGSSFTDSGSAACH